VSDIDALKSLSEADKGARLQVRESWTPGSYVMIGGLGPVNTGFGTRLHVPLSEEQMEKSGDPGIFAELTYEQAMDLNAKLSATLNEMAQKR
jgi:hypothetical protein